MYEVTLPLRENLYDDDENEILTPICSSSEYVYIRIDQSTFTVVSHYVAAIIGFLRNVDYFPTVFDPLTRKRMPDLSKIAEIRKLIKEI